MNCIPIGEQLQFGVGQFWIQAYGLQSSSTLGALDESSTRFPLGTGLTSGNVTENLQAYIDKSTQASSEENSAKLDEYKIVPQNHSLLENDLKNAMSCFLPKKANDNSNILNSELLPCLQNLYNQVSYLHVGHKDKWQENIIKPDEAILGVGAAKDPDAVAVKHHNPDKVCWAKNSQAKATTMESCPSLQCCEGCRMYGSFDALPPCCCDINEGL
ncbi:putative uncharacterized protein C10orf88-like [Rhinopithecus roxellana]|uniref:putative uncharacterized protein C10orf88-like n=1 Tax=Rhinopithecus roxellana TaxID=61622 RepID=UPI0012379741|nr:putative uncharacterized protein C10orf88-like [Rhinopithecus roxellana]